MWTDFAGTGDSHKILTFWSYSNIYIPGSNQSYCMYLSPPFRENSGLCRPWSLVRILKKHVLNLRQVSYTIKPAGRRQADCLRSVPRLALKSDAFLYWHPHAIYTICSHLPIVSSLIFLSLRNRNPELRFNYGLPVLWSAILAVSIVLPLFCHNVAKGSQSKISFD